MQNSNYDYYPPKYQKQTPNPSSHLLGLQCILDKYQHENHMLNQKVSFLIQQNKRLKSNNSHNMSVADRINNIETDRYQKYSHKDRSSSQKYQKYGNIQQSAVLYDSSIKNNYANHCKYDRTSFSPSNKQVSRNYGNSSRKYFDRVQQCYEDPRQRQTQRKQNKYNYTSKSKQVKQVLANRYSRNIHNKTLDYKKIQLNNRINLSIQNINKRIKQLPTAQVLRMGTQSFPTSPKYNNFTNLYSNMPSKEQIRINVIPPSHPHPPTLKQIQIKSVLVNKKSADTQRIGERRSQKIIESTLKCQNNIQKSKQNLKMENEKVNKIDRNAYLQQQTALLIDQSYQKLPTFVQPSFGNINIESKVSSRDSNAKIKEFSRVLQQITNNSHQNLNCNSKITVSNQNSFNVKKKGSHASPSFKLQKTQHQKSQYLFKSHVIETKAQQKQNTIGSGRKTNQPYTKTDYKLSEPKTQLTKMINKQRKKQACNQFIQDLPFMLINRDITAKIDQSATRAETRTQSTKSTNFGRKTFLNVISRKPMQSLFLK